MNLNFCEKILAKTWAVISMNETNEVNAWLTYLYFYIICIPFPEKVKTHSVFFPFYPTHIWGFTEATVQLARKWWQLFSGYSVSLTLNADNFSVDLLEEER